MYQAIKKCGFVANQPNHQLRHIFDNLVVNKMVHPLHWVTKSKCRNGALSNSVILSRHRVSNAVRCHNKGLQGTLATARLPEPGR
jgi:hypothetical protein